MSFLKPSDLWGGGGGEAFRKGHERGSGQRVQVTGLPANNVQCMSHLQVTVLTGQTKESCKATLCRCMHHMYAKSSCRHNVINVMQ